MFKEADLSTHSEEDLKLIFAELSSVQSKVGAEIIGREPVATWEGFNDLLTDFRSNFFQKYPDNNPS
jgi:hypothetical protein